MKLKLAMLYVASVLLTSAFARADMLMPYTNVDQKEVSSQILAQVTDVIADQMTMNLEITGYLPDPCFIKPSVSISQDVADPSVLRIRLTSPLHNEICPARTQSFTSVVNLPMLAQSSSLILESNAVYLVKIEGSEFQMQVVGSHLAKVPGFVAL